MAGIRVEGNTSGNVAEVDSSNNLKVTLPTVATLAGYVRQTDAQGFEVNVTQEQRQSVGLDSLQFYESIDGTVVNTNNWVQSQLSMTQAIASGFLVLNSGAITSINTYSILTSTRQFQMLTNFASHISWMLKTPNIPQANAVMEVGCGFVATTAAPTQSGAYFRWKSDGTFVAVVNWSGTEVPSAPLSNPSINVVHIFDIVISHTVVQFFVDDVLVATIVPGGNAVPVVPTHIPLFARVYTLGAIPSDAPQLFICLAQFIQKDLNNGKPWAHTMAGMHRGAIEGPVTFTQTANHANSTSPTSATLSNTAAGYTTLGGRFQFASPVGAATDFCLFGYQVPVGYTLVITDVKISAVNTGAAVATTATILDWSIAVGSSAVSLATADAPPTTWAPRRLPLGIQSWVVGAAIGTKSDDIAADLSTPLVCDSSRFVQIIVQVPVGTATASQVIRGDVTITGYSE